MRAIPDLPATILDHASVTPIPTGETMPRPVTTTLRFSIGLHCRARFFLPPSMSSIPSPLGAEHDTFHAAPSLADLLEGLPDPVHGSGGDERPDADPFLQHLVQNVRVMLGRAAPGAADLGVVGHQSREVVGHRLRAETDDHHHAGISQKFQSGLLPDLGPAHLEDLPAGSGVEAVLPAQRPEFLADLPRAAAGRRKRQVDPEGLALRQLVRAAADADHDLGAQKLGALGPGHRQAAGAADDDDPGALLV